MKRWLVLALLLIFVFPLWVLAADFPTQVGYVTDFAGMFSAGFRESLEEELSHFEKETTVEIAVATIESLGDYSIEEYAVRLFEDWKIGKKEKDNGILLLVAKKERKVRIEVGYGLEAIITDGRSGRIIREKIRPNFKKENYEEGVKLAVEQIKEYIKSGEPPQGTEAVQETASNFFIFIFIGGLILVYLTSFLGRTKEFVAGGIVGGLLGGFLGLLAGGVSILWLAIVFGAIGFILDYIFSKNYRKLKAAGKSTGFWASRGGFSSKRTSSSGGFGGFGGGSSGGGGASGGW